jgi:hypothetical protein
VVFLDRKDLRMISVHRTFLSHPARSARRIVGLGLAFLASLSGCGNSGAPQRLAVYEVKGKVLLANGKPLSGGDIDFVSATGTSLTPEGKIGPDETFSLTSGYSGEGAPPGDYKVRIEPEDKSLLPGPQPSATGKKLPFSNKYLDEDSSGLRVIIKDEPNQLEPFRLK